MREKPNASSSGDCPLVPRHAIFLHANADFFASHTEFAGWHRLGSPLNVEKRGRLDWKSQENAEEREEEGAVRTRQPRGGPQEKGSKQATIGGGEQFDFSLDRSSARRPLFR